MPPGAKERRAGGTERPVLTPQWLNSCPTAFPLCFLVSVGNMGAKEHLCEGLTTGKQFGLFHVTVGGEFF